MSFHSRFFPVLALLICSVAGCEFGSDGLGLNGPSDSSTNAQDNSGGTDVTAAGQAGFEFAPGNSSSDSSSSQPAAPTIDVDLDVKLHTFFVNGGLLVEAHFKWNTTGGSNVQVKIQWKTGYSEWKDVIVGLPANDVRSVDMSQYAGPGQSTWHFRGVAVDPSFSNAPGYSEIITIQNY